LNWLSIIDPTPAQDAKFGQLGAANKPVLDRPSDAPQVLYQDRRNLSSAESSASRAVLRASIHARLRRVTASAISAIFVIIGLECWTWPNVRLTQERAAGRHVVMVEGEVNERD